MKLKNKKMLIYLIIILLVFAVLVIGTIIINITKINNLETVGDAGEDIEYDTNKVIEVTDKKMFFSAENCINTFIQMLNDDATNYYGYDENNNYTKIVSDKEINDIRINLLDNNYIKKNNINTSNFKEKIETYDKNIMFTPIKMKMIEGGWSNILFTYGIITDKESYEYIKDIYFKIYIDKKNNTFSLEPIELKNNETFDNFEIEYRDLNIEKNDNNIYESKDNDSLPENVAKKYMGYVKRLMVTKPELMYSRLEEKYKNAKFDEYNKFYKYVLNNKATIINAMLKEYKTSIDENIYKIIIKDQYSNIYTIYENNIMDFTIRLDNYTILEDEILEKYNSSTNLNKINMQLARIIESINNKDYEFTYKRINEEFKKQNFANINEFENFIKNNFFDKNEINNISYTEENEIYILSCTIKNSNNSDETKDIKILIKLLENTELEISFSK